MKFTLLKWKSIPESLRLVIILCVIMFPFRSSVADWNYVPSGSMKPTLLEGEQIVVNKLAYDLKVPFTTTHIAAWDNPRRGDIVVLYSPQDGTRLVKRTIGLPGDTIELKNNHLIVNGQAAEYEQADFPAASLLPLHEQQSSIFAQENLVGEKQQAVPHAMMVFAESSRGGNFGPATVPPNQYLMLGDNRDNSKDSRYIGFVPRDAIIGRATHVAFSLDVHHYYLPRFSRFLTALK
ncbi:MAG: signal peptidase I [Burkholderiales bacterium]